MTPETDPLTAVIARWREQADSVEAENESAAYWFRWCSNDLTPIAAALLADRARIEGERDEARAVKIAPARDQAGLDRDYDGLACALRAKEAEIDTLRGVRADLRTQLTTAHAAQAGLREEINKLKEELAQKL